MSTLELIALMCVTVALLCWHIKANPLPTWHEVADELPPMCVLVLVTTDDAVYLAQRHATGSGWIWLRDDGTRWVVGVTAWCEVPR